MENNIKLFEYSIEKREPLVDEFYIKDSGLLITDSPEAPNNLMKINVELLENITAYRIAIENENAEMRKSILKTVHSLMRVKGLNFSEFASFWSVIDVSYSIYRSLTDKEQLDFLDIAIRKYLKMRHGVYLRNGYSATTLQVGKDAKSHKSSGSLGSIKVGEMLVRSGYIKLENLNLNAFKNGDKIFLFSDKGGKKLFKEILKSFQIKFQWSLGRQNKMPDILFKSGKNIFIIEHKHMKEIGGGQDKQVSEVIDFIGYSEPSSLAGVHYVTFLDGLYFNLFSKPSSGDNKIVSQIENIKENLKKNRDNYFVNTGGFDKLLKEIG